MEVARPGDDLSRAVDMGLIALVAGNILAVILQSVEPLERRYNAQFEVFELLSVIVFSSELLLRVWIAVEPRADGMPGSRVRYIFSPMAIADIAAIAPFYLSAFFSLDLRFLRLLRLLRVLKLTRYSGALASVREVLSVNRGAFASAFFLLMLAMIFSSSLMYLVERGAQPDQFSSIPAAMWWAVATLTTVGYGDVTPITPLGKFVASFITIIGVGIIALPTSILASGFSDLHRRNRQRLEFEARSALDDGIISHEEAESYAELAEQLGVEPEEAQQIIALAQHAIESGEARDCPHCGKQVP